MKTNNIKYFICFVIIGIIAIMQSKVNAVKIDTKSHVNIGEEVLVTVDFETYIAAYDGFELSYNERIMKYNSPYELIEGLWWDTSVESTGINKKVYSFTALGNGDNTIRVKIKGLVSANYEMDDLGDINISKTMIIGSGSKLGDLDGNGTVNANDAALVLDLYKYSNITEDDLKEAETKVQKLTDKYITEIDKAVEAKSKEILTV